MGRYTNEQKQQVITEVKETGDIGFVAKKNGIPVTTVQGWVSKDSKSNVSSINDLAKIKQLKKELGDKDLEIEILRDLLKKTYQVWPSD
jgi:transposase-like protein